MGDKFYTNIDGRPTLRELTAGDVSGPSSVVDNAICRFDGTTGKSIQSSLCSIDDSGKVVIGSNTFSSSFPCQLEVVSTGNNIAKFGSSAPVFIQDYYPAINFNLFYNGSNWTVAHNTGGSWYGGAWNFDHLNGGMRLLLMSTAVEASANANTSVFTALTFGKDGILTLGNATQNILVFPEVGYAAPSLTTRSIGTKLVLYPNISASLVDFAFGIEVYCLWSSVPSSNHLFKWYFGTTARYQFEYVNAYFPQTVNIGSVGYSGDRNVALQFFTDNTYTSYGFRIFKYGGANGETYFQHRGNGTLYYNAVDGAYMNFGSNNGTALQIDPFNNMAFFGTVYPVNNGQSFGLSTNQWLINAYSINHSGGYFYIRTNDTSTIEFQTNNTNRYQIGGNGYHYPQYRGYPAMASYVIRHSSTEVTYYSSSRKLKKGIVDMEFDTSLLYQLRPVNFYPYDKEEGNEENKEVGFIAEEVAEIHQKFATYDDKKEPNGISWFLLVTLLVAEAKKINKRLEVLENGNKKRNRNRE